MNLFCAAVFTNSYMPGQNRYEKLNDRERELVVQTPHILESYHYVGRQKFVDDMRREGAKVFLDSGAFSAFHLGVKIDITEYCEYIKRNMDILRIEDGDVLASVLDGIGDPYQTYVNQLEMERQGARPLPCFHFGEDERYLEWYVKNYSYITIGGMVGRPTADLITWLDRVWSKYMVDGSGRARLKVHAFGITSVSVMERYPWYSVDSSSWIQAAAFGSVFTARHGPIAVSSKSPSRHDHGRHITTLSRPERLYVEQMLVAQGFDSARLAEVYESRAAYNLFGYRELNEIINSKKGANIFENPVQELF